MNIHILTQYELLQRINRQLRDTVNERWSTIEKYDAINHAVQKWGTKVMVPYVYSLDDWVSNTREYSLPAYVHEPLDPQYKIDGEDIWGTFPAYEVMPTTGSGTLLVLAFYPPSVDARVIWWTRNSIVPTTVTTVSVELSAVATSLTVASAIDVADAGFIKIDSEWIQYAGRVRGASTTVLSNLVRACFGTTAAVHTTTTSVYWGVAVHRTDLYEQLFHQAAAYLFSLFLTDGSAQEREQHQFNMRWNQQEADKYWPNHTMPRAPKMVLGKGAIGHVYGGEYRDLLTFGDYPWRG
jgi:hypothetical protein